MEVDEPTPTDVPKTEEQKDEKVKTEETPAATESESSSVSFFTVQRIVSPLSDTM